MKSKRTKKIPRPNILGGQLPKLSADIPLKVVMVQSAIDDHSYVRTLLDIGVIDPARIGAGAGTPREILKQGLAAWFEDRKRGINQVYFNMGIISPSNANAFLAANDWRERNLPVSRPCLVIRQYGQENMRTMEAEAEALEAAAPGLFRVVFKLVEAASYRTVYVRTPDELWDDYCYSWYGTDSTETFTKKHIEALKHELQERLGDEASIDEYLPDEIRPVFGFHMWGNDPRVKKKPRDKMTTDELESVSKSSSNPLVQQVAAEAALLQRLLDEAIAIDAKLPQLTEYSSPRCIYSGCCLQYSDHPDVWESLDRLGEELMNGDDNGDYHGLVEIPESPEDLAKFFEKLDLGFRLLRQMDKVIELISHDREYGYEREGDEEEEEETTGQEPIQDPIETQVQEENQPLVQREEQLQREEEFA